MLRHRHWLKARRHSFVSIFKQLKSLFQNALKYFFVECNLESAVQTHQNIYKSAFCNVSSKTYKMKWGKKKSSSTQKWNVRTICDSIAAQFDGPNFFSRFEFRAMPRSKIKIVRPAEFSFAINRNFTIQWVVPYPAKIFSDSCRDKGTSLSW